MRKILKKTVKVFGLLGKFLSNLMIGLLYGVIGGLIYLFTMAASKLSLTNCLRFNFQDIHAQIGVNPANINVSEIVYDYEHNQPIHIPLSLNATLSPNALTVNPECVRSVREPIVWGATAGLILGGVFTTAYQLFKCNARRKSRLQRQDPTVERPREHMYQPVAAAPDSNDPYGRFQTPPDSSPRSPRRPSYTGLINSD